MAFIVENFKFDDDHKKKVRDAIKDITVGICRYEDDHSAWKPFGVKNAGDFWSAGATTKYTSSKDGADIHVFPQYGLGVVAFWTTPDMRVYNQTKYEEGNGSVPVAKDSPDAYVCVSKWRITLNTMKHLSVRLPKTAQGEQEPMRAGWDRTANAYAHWNRPKFGSPESTGTGTTVTVDHFPSKPEFYGSGLREGNVPGYSGLMAFFNNKFVNGDKPKVLKLEAFVVPDCNCRLKDGDLRVAKSTLAYGATTEALDDYHKLEQFHPDDVKIPEALEAPKK